MAKKTESTSRRLTPLELGEERRARELERVLIDCGYDYAEAIQVYANALKTKEPEREELIKVAGAHLSAARAALSRAALALQAVPLAYMP